ncbi:uncharacterized protein PpBr36_11324 [Pyricularia pennisetigena]|uniref:uncharacterized protein n=1 Tax=Pyricularia pennisetigena TaxID=1578925 RepID=UPI001152606E|nr:uncharacterized protein PpBr36_11324 [Pyricularia pennisetigena]TLS20314.1 hypothetical protein PpBr36_11324 [Pyricularia pennisetigena]
MEKMIIIVPIADDNMAAVLGLLGDDRGWNFKLAQANLGGFTRPACFEVEVGRIEAGTNKV